MKDETSLDNLHSVSWGDALPEAPVTVPPPVADDSKVTETGLPVVPDEKVETRPEKTGVELGVSETPASIEAALGGFAESAALATPQTLAGVNFADASADSKSAPSAESPATNTLESETLGASADAPRPPAHPPQHESSTVIVDPSLSVVDPGSADVSEVAAAVKIGASTETPVTHLQLDFASPVRAKTSAPTCEPKMSVIASETASEPSSSRSRTEAPSSDWKVTIIPSFAALQNGTVPSLDERDAPMTQPEIFLPDAVLPPAPRRPLPLSTLVEAEWKALSPISEMNDPPGSAELGAQFSAAASPAPSVEPATTETMSGVATTAKADRRGLLRAGLASAMASLALIFASGSIALPSGFRINEGAVCAAAPVKRQESATIVNPLPPAQEPAGTSTKAEEEAGSQFARASDFRWVGIQGLSWKKRGSRRREVALAPPTPDPTPAGAPVAPAAAAKPEPAFVDPDLQREMGQP